MLTFPKGLGKIAVYDSDDHGIGPTVSGTPTVPYVSEDAAKRIAALRKLARCIVEPNV